MRMNENTPAWARLPEKQITCCGICGRQLCPDDEYEVVKGKTAKRPTFYHITCIHNERGVKL